MAGLIGVGLGLAGGFLLSKLSKDDKLKRNQRPEVERHNPKDHYQQQSQVSNTHNKMSEVTTSGDDSFISTMECHLTMGTEKLIQN